MLVFPWFPKNPKSTSTKSKTKLFFKALFITVPSEIEYKWMWRFKLKQQLLCILWNRLLICWLMFKNIICVVPRLHFHESVCPKLSIKWKLKWPMWLLIIFLFKLHLGFQSSAYWALKISYMSPTWLLLKFS